MVAGVLPVSARCTLTVLPLNNHLLKPVEFGSDGKSGYG